MPGGYPVSFLDRLSEYLQDVGDSVEYPLDAGISDGVDPAFARNALIRCLERLERGENVAEWRRQRPTSIENLFASWQDKDDVVRFANQVFLLLGESIGNGASHDEMYEWIEIAIARQIGLDVALSSRIRTMELDRLAEIARFEMIDDENRSEVVDRIKYSSAIRATREVDSKLALTPVGRVFLEMQGRDAIRWLLHIEAAQSFGPGDRWRIDRETAAGLVRQEIWQIELEDSLPCSRATIDRLAAFGVLIARDVVGGEGDSASYQYEEIKILPVGYDVLKEIAEKNGSPMSVMAESILADLTLSATNRATGRNGKTTEDARSGAVAEASARHSRLVAHEIRNMLVPVKTALNAFYREMLLTEKPGEVVAQRRDGIDRGIDSVFRFVDQLVELSQFVTVPPEPFELLSAIRDAISMIEDESGRHIEPILPETLPPVSGHRARAITALINVMRNAVQAVPSKSPLIRIEAEAIEGASAVRISIEDNGPGVPEPMRRAIFGEGVSLREGSGLGLALVREVFEKEMRGLVACDASPLGGARFVIRVPATGTER